MPNRASVSRISGSTVPRSSPITDHPVADALERQHAHEILGHLAHVCALRGIAAVGNPVEAEQAHHVIDAQRAAVAAIAADRFGEQPVAVFAMRLRIGRRKAPILALGREIVGRRAHAATANKERPMRPQVGAEVVGRQRQIVIETDRHVCARASSPARRAIGRSICHCKY